MKTRIVVLSVLCLGLFLVMVCSVRYASAAEFNWKYAHVQPEKHVSTKAALFLADELKKRSNGKIEMKVFPGGVLGRPTEVLDSMNAGDIDMGWITTANLSTSIKEFNIFSVAYLFKNKQHFVNNFVEGSYVWDRMIQLVEKSPYGVKLVGQMASVSRQLYNSVKAVNNVDDVKGLKIRVQSSPVEVKVWSALGTVPAQLAWTEIYTALQTGVVQAAESTIDAYSKNKFYEVAPHFAWTNHQFPVMLLLLSKKSYEKLPEDLRPVVLKAAWESSFLCQKLYSDSQEELEKKMKAEGLAKMTYPDVASFQAKVAPIVDEEAAKYKVEDIVKAIRESAK